MGGKYREPSWAIERAYRLWETQVNARGGLLGRPVRLLILDDESDPDKVPLLYRRLLDQEKVDLVLSPYSSPLTLAASEMTEKRGMVMIVSGAASDRIWTRGHRFSIGVYATSDRFLVGFLDLIAGQGLKTLAILHENSPFGVDTATGARRWAERFKLTTLVYKGYDQGALALPALLEDVSSSGAQALLLAAYSEDCYSLLSAMKSLAYHPRALAMTIGPLHPDFCKRAGEMCEGVFGPSQWEPDERIPFPGTTRFVKDYMAFAGLLPSYHAGCAYAACQMMERAVLHCGSLDQEALRQFLMTQDTVTVIGRFKVDATGRQIGHTPILVQWQKGKKEIVYPSKMQTASPVFLKKP